MINIVQSQWTSDQRRFTYKLSFVNPNDAGSQSQRTHVGQTAGRHSVHCASEMETGLKQGSLEEMLLTLTCRV